METKWIIHGNLTPNVRTLKSWEIGQAWWCMPIIPKIKEPEAVGSQVQR
jgi:hypothetical protein